MKLQSLDAAYDLTTGRGRLRYLADEVLARVTREALPFNFVTWFASDPHDCGTAACAAGWAARDPLLQDQGLGLPARPGGFPTINGKHDPEGFDRFWGLSTQQASDLFTQGVEDRDTTAADVADRIREHLVRTAE